MNKLITITFLTLISICCSNKQSSKDEKLPALETEQKKKKPFTHIANFPTINDTTQFISDLRQSFDLEVRESPVQKENEKITAYKKVKIYGSTQEFIFIEYDWNAGSMAEFPWKFQLLLTTNGKLVKTLDGLRFDFVTIFPNQNPFLMTIKATSKGNGGHEFYKISADTIQNVYEGYFRYEVQTYDAHKDLSVFEPSELRVKFNDENKDGLNDIVFTGYKLMLGKYTKDSVWYDVENGRPFTIENPADRILIKYIFLYDNKTGHFKAKEKY